MPFELTFPVQAEQTWAPTLDDQRAMHAILLEALARSDVALAQTVHAAHINPFTQALLSPRSEGDGMTWRITLLDDALYEPLVGGLHAAPPTGVQDRPVTLDLAALESRHQTYDALSATPVAFRHDMHFITPATFRTQYYHSPLPEPYLCWQSWWTRWQAFAPPRLAINVAVLDVVAAHLVVTRFQLASRMVAGRNWRVIGAVGRICYTTIQTGKLEETWWRSVTSLAAFSAICGSGHKTAFGLGQTQWQAGG